MAAGVSPASIHWQNAGVVRRACPPPIGLRARKPAEDDDTFTLRSFPPGDATDGCRPTTAVVGARGPMSAQPRGNVSVSGSVGAQGSSSHPTTVTTPLGVSRGPRTPASHPGYPARLTLISRAYPTQRLRFAWMPQRSRCGRIAYAAGCVRKGGPTPTPACPRPRHARYR
jgi:hypothetical protein